MESRPYQTHQVLRSDSSQSEQEQQTQFESGPVHRPNPPSLPSGAQAFAAGSFNMAAEKERHFIGDILADDNSEDSDLSERPLPPEKNILTDLSEKKSSASPVSQKEQLASHGSDKEEQESDSDSDGQKIYGTQNYYKFYNGLQPSQRDPNLPKPTYRQASFHAERPSQPEKVEENPSFKSDTVDSEPQDFKDSKDSKDQKLKPFASPPKERSKSPNTEVPEDRPLSQQPCLVGEYPSFSQADPIHSGPPSPKPAEEEEEIQIPDVEEAKTDTVTSEDQLQNLHDSHKQFIAQNMQILQTLIEKYQQLQAESYQQIKNFQMQPQGQQPIVDPKIQAKLHECMAQIQQQKEFISKLKSSALPVFNTPLQETKPTPEAVAVQTPKEPVREEQEKERQPFPKKQREGASQIMRSPFLQELVHKISSGEPINYHILRGHVYECAVDQQGSRYIQKTLNETKDEPSQEPDIFMPANSPESLESQPFKDLVFQEVVPCIQELMNDVFGNYVIQKLIEFGSAKQKSTVVNQILGKMVKLTRSKYGCRVIQKAFEFADQDQRNLLIYELKNINVLELIQDQNANHVVQKCLQHLQYDQTQFIIKRVVLKLEKFCMHTYGCRVIQQVLLVAKHQEQQKIVDYIVNPNHFDAMILDQYGNYLIQTIMDMGNFSKLTGNQNPIKFMADAHQAPLILSLYEQAREQIYNQIDGCLAKYSCHKFASNVIEKCIKESTSQQFVNFLLALTGLPAVEEAGFQGDLEERQSVLFRLINDKFGNYVIQKTFDTLFTKQQQGDDSSFLESYSILQRALLYRILQLEKHFLEGDSKRRPLRYIAGCSKYVFDSIGKRLPDEVAAIRSKLDSEPSQHQPQANQGRGLRGRGRGGPQQSFRGGRGGRGGQQPMMSQPQQQMGYYPMQFNPMMNYDQRKPADFAPMMYPQYVPHPQQWEQPPKRGKYPPGKRGGGRRNPG